MTAKAVRKAAKLSPKLPAKLPKYQYCTNCSQAVSGAIARNAANPEVKYCSASKDKLTAAGTCPNPDCPWYNMTPPGA
jgi:hypothetical protein